MTHPAPDLPPGVNEVLVIPGAEAVPHGFIDLSADRTVPSLSLGSTLLKVNGYQLKLPTTGVLRIVVPAGPVRVEVSTLLPIIDTHLDLFIAPGQAIPVLHRHSWIENHPGYLSTTPLGPTTPGERKVFLIIGLAFAGILVSGLLMAAVIFLFVQALP